MFNPTLKRRETILFFLIVVINGLTWIVSDIGLDTCARRRWRVEVSKMEMNFLKESECRASVQIVLCNFFLYVNNIQKYYSVSHCVISIIIVFAPTHMHTHLPTLCLNVVLSMSGRQSKSWTYFYFIVWNMWFSLFFPFFIKFFLLLAKRS